MLETRISSGAAWLATQAASGTATPLTRSSRTSHSPVCSPARVAKAEVAGRIADRFRAADRPGRPVERRHDPVAGQLERAAPEAVELPGGQRLEAVLEIGPAPVAERDRLPGRAGDLAHQDGGQDVVGHARPAACR